MFNKMIILWKHKKPIFVPLDAHHELTVMGQYSVFFSAGQVIQNLAYSAPSCGSSRLPLSRPTDGIDYNAATLSEIGVWNFVAVDLGSPKTLGLIRIKLRITKSKHQFIVLYAIR